MTVAELIQQLQRFDPELLVVRLHDEFNMEAPIHDVDEMTSYTLELLPLRCVVLH